MSISVKVILKVGKLLSLMHIQLSPVERTRGSGGLLLWNVANFHLAHCEVRHLRMVSNFLFDLTEIFIIKSMAIESKNSLLRLQKIFAHDFFQWEPSISVPLRITLFRYTYLFFLIKKYLQKLQRRFSFHSF